MKTVSIILLLTLHSSSISARWHEHGLRGTTWLIAPVGGNRQIGGLLSTQLKDTKCAVHYMEFLRHISLTIRKQD